MFKISVKMYNILVILVDFLWKFSIILTGLLPDPWLAEMKRIQTIRIWNQTLLLTISYIDTASYPMLGKDNYNI